MSQNEDYRIIMINTFELHAYHILCEVSCTCVYTDCCDSAKEFAQTERIINANSFAFDMHLCMNCMHYYVHTGLS